MANNNNDERDSLKPPTPPASVADDEPMDRAPEVDDEASTSRGEPRLASFFPDDPEI